MLTALLISFCVNVLLAMQTFMLAIGTILLKLPRRGNYRAFAVSAGTLLFALFYYWLIAPRMPATPSHFANGAIWLFAVLAHVWVNWCLIMWLHGGSIPRVAGAWAVSMVGVGIWAGLYSWLAPEYLLFSQTVNSNEMTPAVGIQSGDRVLINRIQPLRRWDIVSCRNPLERQQILLVRVVGFPGENITIRDGVVLVDREARERPAEIESIRYEPPMRNSEKGKPVLGEPGKTIVLLQDEYLVLADNASSTADSRYFGAVKRSDILGVAEWIWSPFERIRLLR